MAVAVEERFLRYVDKTEGGCWMWIGFIGNLGYGQFRYEGKSVGAHQAAFALWKGGLEPGRVIYHTCRNRPCVNPDHLTQITPHDLKRAFKAVGKRTPPTPEEVVGRFLDQIEITESCWLWTGYVQKGYGRFYPSRGKTVYAHRFAYQTWVGPLEPGLVVHHVCYVRNCVNPDHLRQVTHRENILDEGASSASRLNHIKTHCHRGHEFTPENTKWTVVGESRRKVCLTCRREYRRPDRRCASCGEIRASAARGLCKRCYAFASRHGTLPEAGAA